MALNLVTFQDCCHVVVHSCPDPYAQAYAKAGLDLDDENAMRVQALYILNNMQYWRGDAAKAVRAKLKEIGKVKR